MQSALDGDDHLGPLAEHDELVRDEAARCIPASQRIREAQGYSIVGAVKRCRCVLDIREDAVVNRKGVGQAGCEEEPEAPGAPSGSPDEAVGELLIRVHFRLLISNLSLTPCSRSSLNCVRVAVR